MHQAIHQVLIKEWDPIGIRHIPEAQDEYDQYIPQIYQMLISSKPKHELFDYLWELERDHMALSGNHQKTERCAEMLLKLID